MNRILLILAITSISVLVHGQEDEVQNKYNLDSVCYTLDGQQPVNYCLSCVVDTLSVTIKNKFDCLVAFFDKEIKSHSNNKPEIAAYYNRAKQNIIISQATWEKLKDENAEYYADGEGTITPMLIAQCLIKDLKDRLNWLDLIIEEEGQGDHTAVLKCEEQSVYH